MGDLLNTLFDLGTIDLLLATVGISMITLALVYIPGRMFEIINSFRVKNMIALLSISIFTYCYLKEFRIDIETWGHFWYSYSLHFGVAIVIYVCICMRLFDRIDRFLDKKGLKDKGFKIKK